MKHTVKAATSAAIITTALASSAQAGGIDRSGQSITALFEKGRYVELSLGSVSPSTSGIAAAVLGGVGSGDLTPSYVQAGAAYKADINDRFSYAIIYDQPFGADVAYPLGTGYFAQGSSAEFRSHAISGILRYKFDENFSVHGGLKLQSVEASASIPFASGYSVSGERDVALGYLAGVAYERPDIALRVSLTYHSSIAHDVRTTETSTALGGPNQSITRLETPEALNLEFQTGIAKDTLLFGGLRWTEYSAFDISPANFGVLTSGGSLLSYDDDIFTWSLGVGRKLNDTWSVSASLGYEKSNGGFQSNLGPTDGNKSIALAAVYTRDNMKVTTGIRYVDIGDSQTQITGVSPAASFDDNKAIAVGVKVGWTF